MIHDWCRGNVVIEGIRSSSTAIWKHRQPISDGHSLLLSRFCLSLASGGLRLLTASKRVLVTVGEYQLDFYQVFGCFEHCSLYLSLRARIIFQDANDILSANEACKKLPSPFKKRRKGVLVEAYKSYPSIPRDTPESARKSVQELLQYGNEAYVDRMPSSVITVDNDSTTSMWLSTKGMKWPPVWQRRTIFELCRVAFLALT